MSSIEPKKIDEALKDVDWANAMHEEFNNFTRNQVWELVERPKGHNVIGTKCVAEPPKESGPHAPIVVLTDLG